MYLRTVILKYPQNTKHHLLKIKYLPNVFQLTNKTSCVARNNCTLNNKENFPRDVKKTPEDANRSNHVSSKNVSEVPNKSRPFTDIPGPSALPILGTLHHYLPIIGKYSMNRLHWNGLSKLREFGPLVREKFPGNTTVLWVFDPEDIKQVLAADGKYPRRRSHLALQKYRLDRPEMYSSGGLIPTNGEEWWALRRPSQRVMTRMPCVRVHLPATDLVCKDFTQLVDASLDPDSRQVIDLLMLLKRIFLELTVVSAMDTRLGCLSAVDLPDDSEAAMLIKAAKDTNKDTLSTDNGLQLWRLFSTPLYSKIVKGQDTIHRTALKFVEAKARELTLQEQSYSENIASEEQCPISSSNTTNNTTTPTTTTTTTTTPPPPRGSSIHSQSMLEYFLQDSGLNTIEIVTVICDTILAGIETGAYTMSFLMYHLATNPDKQAILAEEARTLLPNDSDVVTVDILNKARYTKAVIKESFRLNPISVGIGRIAGPNTIIRGFNIPEGTTLVTQNQISCRLPKYFNDPDKFLPERWLGIDGGHSSSKPDPFLLLPFGHGLRSCIGRRLAEQNLYTLTLHLARMYSLGWTGPKLDCFTNLINEPDCRLGISFNKE